MPNYFNPLLDTKEGVNVKGTNFKIVIFKKETMQENNLINLL